MANRFGDVNGDGRITVRDATITLRAAAGLETLTPEQKYVADVNGDGKVSVADATLILRYAVGLIKKFPVEDLMGLRISYLTGREFTWVRNEPFVTDIIEGQPDTYINVVLNPDGSPMKLWRYMFFRDHGETRIYSEKYIENNQIKYRDYVFRKVTFWNHPYGYVYHKWVCIAGPEEYLGEPTLCYYRAEYKIRTWSDDLQKWWDRYVQLKTYLMGTNALKNTSGDTKYIYDVPNGKKVNEVPANWIITNAHDSHWDYVDSMGWFKVNYKSADWNPPIPIDAPGWVWAGITRQRNNYDFKSYQHANLTCGS